MVLRTAGVRLRRRGYVDAREALNISPLLLRYYDKKISDPHHFSLDELLMERIKRAILDCKAQREKELEQERSKTFRRRPAQEKTKQGRQALIDAAVKRRLRNDMHVNFMKHIAKCHDLGCCCSWIIRPDGSLETVSNFSDCYCCRTWLLFRFRDYDATMQAAIATMSTKSERNHAGALPKRR